MDLFASLEAFMKNPTLDVLVVLFVLVAGFFLGTTRGKAKLLSFVFATYIALYLTPVLLRFAEGMDIAPFAYHNIGVYLATLLVAAIIMDRCVFAGQSRASYSWWQALIVSFCAVGFFVAGTLNLRVAHGIVDFSPITLSLFAGSTAYLAWSVAPLIGLVIASRGR